MNDLKFDDFLVSKETVVLRWWERSKQKFGFSPSVQAFYDAPSL